MPPLSSATDAFLASRAADGDQIAFAVLVRRHAPFLVAFATKLTGSRADADDCVQEALITAWRRLPDLADPEKVRSWLTTIVSRKVTDRMRATSPVSVPPVTLVSVALSISGARLRRINLSRSARLPML